MLTVFDLLDERRLPNATVHVVGHTFPLDVDASPLLSLLMCGSQFAQQSDGIDARILAQLLWNYLKV